MTTQPTGMTYAGSGVDYDALDSFKRAAQLAARMTTSALDRLGINAFEASRGESAFLIETRDGFLAHVEEGLGTKNLIADAMQELTGRSYYYGAIAQDTVAMIVNDLATVGAVPLSVAMHLAVGSSSWFNDDDRANDLIIGWREACLLARATWGGGETPTLKGIVVPGTAVLSGSAIGIIEPKSKRIKGDIVHGDAIVLITSSGVHANGLTLCRRIAETLPGGYRTVLPNGASYGETLLQPTFIYSPIVEDCLDAGVEVHYAVNITGHGWRKLMRANGSFAYVIEQLPQKLPIFDFIQKKGLVSDREMYGNFNMGAGFALIVPEGDVEAVIDIVAAQQEGNRPTAFCAGHVSSSAKKEVVIKPMDLVFESGTLTVR